MNYETHFSRRKYIFRSNNNDNVFRQYNNHEYLWLQEEIPVRGFGGSRRQSGHFPRNYSRDEYMRKSYKLDQSDIHEYDNYQTSENWRDAFRSKEPNFDIMRRSFSEYPRVVLRSRHLSLKDKECNSREVNPYGNDFQRMTGQCGIDKSDIFLEYPLVASLEAISLDSDEEWLSTIKYKVDLKGESFSERRRNDFISRKRKSSECRSRSPNKRQRYYRNNGPCGRSLND